MTQRCFLLLLKYEWAIGVNEHIQISCAHTEQDPGQPDLWGSVLVTPLTAGTLLKQLQREEISVICSNSLIRM